MISRRQIIEKQQELNVRNLPVAKVNSEKVRSQKVDKEKNHQMMDNNQMTRNKIRLIDKIKSELNDKLQPDPEIAARVVGKSGKSELGYRSELMMNKQRNSREKFATSSQLGDNVRVNIKQHQEQQPKQQQFKQPEEEEEEEDDDDDDDEQGFSLEDEDEDEKLEKTDLSADYRHFDPYSVYGEEDEEEDVWFSEERLFEVSLLRSKLPAQLLDFE